MNSPVTSTETAPKQIDSIWNGAKFQDEVDADAYSNASPFPHAVFQEMLTVGPEILRSFPNAEWESWKSLGDTYQFRKFSCSSIEVIPELFAHLIYELSSPTFLHALEKLTGIDKLIPDPYLTGGGLHMSGPGGVLAPHTDFHLYEQLGLYRRINVLVYLNEEWDESYGGCLELGDVGSKTSTVVPHWGTTMVFTTSSKSVHGFPKPITEGHWRRSVALYYYTAEETKDFQGDTTTYWRDHGVQTGPIKKFRLGIYQALNTLSKGISLLAHLANPNQGMGWWKIRQARLAQEAAEQHKD